MLLIYPFINALTWFCYLVCIKQTFWIHFHENHVTKLYISCQLIVWTIPVGPFLQGVQLTNTLRKMCSRVLFAPVCQKCHSVKLWRENKIISETLCQKKLCYSKVSILSCLMLNESILENKSHQIFRSLGIQ